jgi:protein-tyrosine phosphatase
LLEDGVTVFVDLTEDGELKPYAHELPEGVRHVRMPIADWGVPSEEQMAETLDLIDGALADGEVVYVHCRAGIGRTRTVICCHRRRHGRPTGLEPETGEQRAFVRGWTLGR